MLQVLMRARPSSLQSVGIRAFRPVAVADHPGAGLDTRHLLLALPSRTLAWGVFGIFAGATDLPVLFGSSWVASVRMRWTQFGVALVFGPDLRLTAKRSIATQTAKHLPMQSSGVIGRSIANAPGPWWRPLQCFGQFLMVPTGKAFSSSHLGWRTAGTRRGGLVLLIAPLAEPARAQDGGAQGPARQTIAQALGGRSSTRASSC
jgi:hypothetical protein